MTGEFSPRQTRGRARRSWWGQSIWRRCEPSDSGGEVIISFPIYELKPILISTPGLSFAPVDAGNEAPRV